MSDLLSAENQAIVLQALVLASLLVPVFERLAAKTENVWDDKLVAALKVALALIPRIGLGAKK